MREAEPAAAAIEVEGADPEIEEDRVGGGERARGDDGLEVTKASLDQLEPAADGLVVTQNHSDRSMDPAKLADLAAGIFGPDRVRVADRLDGAIEVAVGLADEAAADGLGGTGVLVTGSVVTAGDARSLLGAGEGTAGGRGEGADLG